MNLQTILLVCLALAYAQGCVPGLPDFGELMCKCADGKELLCKDAKHRPAEDLCLPIFDSGAPGSAEGSVANGHAHLPIAHTSVC